MKNFLLPLKIFVVGNVLLIVVILLMPFLAEAETQLQADTAAYSSTFWGWSWASGSVRLFVWLGVEAGILWATGKAFLGLRNN